MAYTYQSYIAAIQNLAVIPANQTDSAFTSIVPSMIAYAEGRIYREIDLLSTTISDSSAALTSGSRTFTMPTAGGRFVTVQELNIITPAIVTDPEQGTRNAMVPTTKEYMNMVWNSATGAAIPTQFAMLTDQTVIVGPWPDADYTVEVVGTIRPAPLSMTNTTTFLSQYLPDLFVAASMVFISGYQQNFGAQSDNPQMAASWETQYQSLFSSANAEEMRKKFAGALGTSKPVKPLAMQGPA